MLTRQIWSAPPPTAADGADFHKMRPPTDGEGSYGDHARLDSKTALIGRPGNSSTLSSAPTASTTSRRSRHASVSQIQLTLQRKPPAPRKQGGASAPPPPSNGAAPAARDPQHDAIVANIHAQVQGLGQAHGGLASHVMALTKDYQARRLSSSRADPRSRWWPSCRAVSGQSSRRIACCPR